MDKNVYIRAYHSNTGEVHDMDPHNLAEYTAWVERGVARGYKSHDLGCGVVRFTSEREHEHVVFTAKIGVKWGC